MAHCTDSRMKERRIMPEGADGTKIFAAQKSRCKFPSIFIEVAPIIPM